MKVRECGVAQRLALCTTLSERVPLCAQFGPTRDDGRAVAVTSRCTKGLHGKKGRMDKDVKLGSTRFSHTSAVQQMGR